MEPPWLRSGRVPGLDGLRGLSILLVMLDHLVETEGFPAPALLRGIGFIGPMGVDVFFMISGFLITLLLTRELEQTATISLRAFYCRRVLRLMPAFALYVISLFCLAQLEVVAVRPSEWPWVVTYTVNYHPDPTWEVSHIWSLSVEEQFYLTWPLVLLFIRPERWRPILIGCLLTAPVFRLATSLLLPEYSIQANFWTPTRMDAIAAGCLMALLAQSPEFRRKTAWIGRAAIKPLLVALVILGAGLVLSRIVPHFRPALGYSSKVAAIACFMWVVLSNTAHRSIRVLEWRPLAWLGVLSYSLYLWQQLFLNHTKSEWIYQWPQNLVAALLAATASYALVESRVLKLRDRVLARLAAA